MATGKKDDSAAYFMLALAVFFVWTPDLFDLYVPKNHTDNDNSDTYYPLPFLQPECANNFKQSTWPRPNVSSLPWVGLVENSIEGGCLIFTATPVSDSFEHVRSNLSLSDTGVRISSECPDNCSNCSPNSDSCSSNSALSNNARRSCVCHFDIFVVCGDST